jgi:hypothetical protein
MLSEVKYSLNLLATVGFSEVTVLPFLIIMFSLCASFSKMDHRPDFPGVINMISIFQISF